MRKLLFIGAPAVLAIAAALPLTATAAQATIPPSTVTAVTQITHRPDGGNAGNWASDSFTRTATIHRVGQVGLSNCPGSTTGKCFAWPFKIADSGPFTTQPSGGPAAYNGLSPRTGAVLDLAVTGNFFGGTHTGTFFSDTQAATGTVPATEDDADGLPAGQSTTTLWVEQFFPASAVFNSGANPGGPDLGNWSWTYTLPFGGRPARTTPTGGWTPTLPAAAQHRRDILPQ